MLSLLGGSVSRNSDKETYMSRYEGFSVLNLDSGGDVSFHGVRFESDTSDAVESQDYACEVLSVSGVDWPAVGTCVELRVGSVAIMIHADRVREVASLMLSHLEGK
jgi:hypothetical protein